jgi:hypothetical protein
MRLPAGLEATGATVSLDGLLGIEQARAADPDPTPVKAGAWHTGSTLGPDRAAVTRPRGDTDADDGEDGRLREALGRRVRVEGPRSRSGLLHQRRDLPSPLIARLSHDPSGTVQGKAALRAYVKKGFEVFDHIKFTVLDVLRGVDSIAIHYKGITGTHVVEVLFFDNDGVVRESYVHYSSAE